MTGQWTRRGLLLGGSGAWLAAAAALALPNPPSRAGAGTVDAVGARLLPWKPGCLDIHHIATGRGDAALAIGPSGQSLLIDAGASNAPLTHSVAPRPSGDRRPGEWIARYAQRRLEATGKSGIDAALVTHLHPDHLGDVQPTSPQATTGDYRLTGLSDVDALCPIGLLVDRGFPSYDWPAKFDAPFAANYERYIRARRQSGRRTERIRIGAADQLAAPDAARGFEIRTIAGNGEVWTGAGADAASVIPPLSSLAQEDWPDENVLSCAVRIRMGAFAYYAGGDLTANSYDGALPWRDVGAKAARACGPADVVVAPHHGMFDGVSGDMVRALAPRAWIVQTWHASHPNMSAVERMLSRRLYPGPREIFATGLTPAAAVVNQRLVDCFAARRGHIVIRVAEGGASYTIVVTDNSDERDRVVAVFGPYAARSQARGQPN